MKCKLNGNEIESLFPCSRNCPLFGDCMVQYEKESEKRNRPTNADRIRAMTDEELERFLDRVYCKGWNNGANDNSDQDPNYHEWLQQPAENFGQKYCPDQKEGDY